MNPKRIVALFDAIDDVEIYLELRPYKVDKDICVFVLLLSVKNTYINVKTMFGLASTDGFFENGFEDGQKKLDAMFKYLYDFLDENDESGKKRVYMIRDMLLANQSINIPLKLEEESETKYFFTRLEKNAPI